MNREHPIIIPHDGLGLAVVWHGSITFNVHDWTPGDDALLGREVDVFTAYGETSERPTMHEAYYHIKEWFDAQEDDEDTCDTEGCNNSLKDGEGYDGKCGDCADRIFIAESVDLAAVCEGTNDDGTDVYVVDCQACGIVVDTYPEDEDGAARPFAEEAARYHNRIEHGADR